eukprot:Selendium_serpulae@DN5520_c1_g1_i1.p1
MKLTFIVAALGFAAVALGNEHEDFDIVSLFQDAEITTELISKAKEHVSSRFQDSMTNEGHSDCKTCVWQAAQKVVQWNEEHWEKWCHETKDHRAEEMCRRAKHHPGIALGFLIEEVRPISLGYLWCLGAKYCKAEEESRLIEKIEDVGHSMVLEELSSMSKDMEVPFSQAMKAQEQTETFEERVWSQMLEHKRKHPHHREQGCECFKCVRASTLVLQNDHFGALMGMCDEHHDCKILTKVCKAVKNHPVVAYGFVMGMLKPWKFGTGYCVAKHHCSYWNFHHHNHCHMEGDMEQDMPRPHEIPPHEVYGRHGRRRFRETFDDVRHAPIPRGEVENFPEVMGKPLFLEK